LRDVRNPTLQVLHVDLSGKRASALVRSTATGQPPSTDTLELVREKGGWRVGSLAGAQAPRPRKPGPAS
jgi:hypothetical protein